MRHRFLAGFSLMQAVLAAVAVWRGVIRLNEAATEAQGQHLKDQVQIAGLVLREGVPPERLADDPRLEAGRMGFSLQVERLGGQTSEPPGRPGVPVLAASKSGTPMAELLVDLPEKAGGRMKLRLSGQSASQHRRRVAGLVLGGVIYVGLSVGAAAVLTRRWLRALGRMSEAARRLGLDPTAKGRLPVPKTEAELAAFAETLNGFLDRLEADYGARNRFLADAAHELRTPLTALRAEIDVALRRDREPARYRQVLESNREELVRLSELIDGLLTLARADAGESIRPTVPLDSVPLAAQAVERFRPLALQRGIDLVLSQESGPGATIPVRADARSVERILDNLLSNALRHTDAGGRVTVSGRTAGSRAILEITDTGTGIPPAHVARVFDRFYRVESGRGAGAGLGLAIVKALVEVLGGDVRLESELGRGTRVEVRLPLA